LEANAAGKLNEYGRAPPALPQLASLAFCVQLLARGQRSPLRLSNRLPRLVLIFGRRLVTLDWQIGYGGCVASLDVASEQASEQAQVDVASTQGPPRSMALDFGRALFFFDSRKSRKSRNERRYLRIFFRSLRCAPGR
jgi:hypothetical protein